MVAYLNLNTYANVSLFLLDELVLFSLVYFSKWTLEAGNISWRSKVNPHSHFRLDVIAAWRSKEKQRYVWK